jgi:thiosulfate dehydrogenase [quinone] large subunit
MDWTTEKWRGDAELAYGLLRAFLGFNIMMHGISRIISGPGTFAATLVQQFQATPMANGVVSGFGYALPWLELILGLMLLVGIFTRWVVVAGFVLLGVLTYGTALIQDWETTGLQLTYALVYALLLAFVGWNRWSVDAWRAKHKITITPAE